VGDAIDGHRFEAWKAEDDFIAIGDARVPRIGGIDIFRELSTKLWDSLEQTDRDFLPFGLVIIRFAAAFDAKAIDAICVDQGAGDLRGESIMKGIDQVPDVVRYIAGMQSLSASKTGIKNIFQVFDDLNDDFVLGERAVAQMVNPV
jgi:hypothetical protein